MYWKNPSWSGFFWSVFGYDQQGLSLNGVPFIAGFPPKAHLGCWGYVHLETFQLFICILLPLPISPLVGYPLLFTVMNHYSLFTTLPLNINTQSFAILAIHPHESSFATVIKSASLFHVPLLHEAINLLLTILPVVNHQLSVHSIFLFMVSHRYACICMYLPLYMTCLLTMPRRAETLATDYQPSCVHQPS